MNDALNQSDYLLTCVLEGKSEEVAECVDKVHSTNTSLLRYNDENSLACVLSLAFYSARSKYHIIRELPAGKGFADIVLVPAPMRKLLQSFSNSNTTRRLPPPSNR